MFVNYKSSWDKRALALLLAVAVVFVGLPFVGVDTSLKASAETPTGNIRSNTEYKYSNQTDSMNTHRSATGNLFVYTGKYVNNNKTTLFDYVSDYELAGTYNNCKQNEAGDVDAYPTLNHAISSTTLNAIDNHEENITFIYRPCRKGVTDVSIHLFDDNNHNNGWPGYSMTYDTYRKVYILTMKFSDVVSKLSGNAPTHFIINGHDSLSGSSSMFETETINTGTMTAGKSYEYADYNETTGTANQVTFTLPKSIARALKVSSSIGGKNYLEDGEWSGTNYPVKVNIWDDNGHYNSSARPDMTYSSTTGNWTCTLNNISEYNSEFYVTFQSRKYHWYNTSNSTNGYYLADDYGDKSAQTDAFVVRKGYNYTFTVTPVIGTADNTNCAYTYPLYFGCFIRGTGDSASDYTSSNKPYYNNFFWQANTSLKPAGATQGTASVQKLVYSKLSGNDNDNSTGELLDINNVTQTSNGTTTTISGNVLPYLSKSWATAHPELIKYYDKDKIDGKDYDLTFPFYESYSNFNNSSGKNTINSGTVKIDKYDNSWNTNGEVARFYQFDSRESNLRFNIDNSNSHTGYFSETNTDIYRGSSVAADRKNVGFFPFNSTNVQNGNENNHNLGFGTKFEMDFQLEEDGCVSAVKLDNGTLSSIDTETRIHTIFEFSGDDDLWVFIDGNLVLDMGGAHNRSTGRIDFADKTVTVDRAIDIKTTGDLSGRTAGDDLSAPVGNDPPGDATVNNANFVKLLSGHNFDSTNPGKYDTKETHTMTIFYMERGMLDSNLMIRYNYSPVENASKMKVAEVTKFDGVNDGLLDLTKTAAEDHIFKYTITNQGTDPADTLDNKAKYKATASSTRKNSVSLWETALNAFDLNGTPTAYKYTPPTNTSTPSRVKGTSYLWVDKFADNSETVGITSTGTTGNYNDGGEFLLMYGTDPDLYNKAKSDERKRAEKESSAEFVKQFSKNSIMEVVQGTNLYSPDRNPTTHQGTLYAADGTLKAVQQDGTNNTENKPVVNYYSTEYRVVDRNGNPVTLSNRTNGGTFTFSNRTETNSAEVTNPVGANLAVQLTEYVENTVRTGTLTIENEIENPTSADADEEFEYTITISNVFGGAGNDVTDYTKIKAAMGTWGNSETVGTPATGVISNNTVQFKLKHGEKLVIEGIPLGTSYSVTENENPDFTTTCEVNGSASPNNYNGSGKHSYSGTNSSGSAASNTSNKFLINASGRALGSTSSGERIGHEDQVVHFTHTRGPTELTAKKEDESGNALAGAELELYFKEETPAPTYSFNTPEIVPSEKIENKILQSSISIPKPEKKFDEVTVETKSYTYGTDVDSPTASDSDWILPRSDADYIYFRDYNSNTSSLGEWDKPSFDSNENAAKTAWRWSYAEPKSSGTHHQDNEIGFKDNSEWIEAQFTKDGQNMVKYAVWERFVDKYNGTDTVVWKIQPPDGYNQVRFCLYRGSQCVRTTERFNFELGKIYQKTGWGKYYSYENGQHCYYEVPVNKTTAEYWAPHSGFVKDQRTNNSSMDQAIKYEPTEQKVIFHCNSANVWHNIHIQFFDENGNSVNGQPFPGYMMEPYAYAGNDYRMSDGYLTYELTIPANAKYFQINNGIDSGTYAYKTEIKELYTANNNPTNDKNAKNYDNYFCLSDYSKDDNNHTTDNEKTGDLYKLVDWGMNNNNDPQKTANYTTNSVESDYDYIYFEKPSGWGNNVYAYFYGGGNLRADNWQRACYSAWPGVAPAGTEYVDGTAVHSNTYTIKAEGTTNEYNSTDTNGTLSPEATFTIGSNTIYKFRVPKGDRKNYSKVIFNDGLSIMGGSNETGVIEYQPGYLYKSNGSCSKHYDSQPTVTYTARSGNDDYIYVKMNDITYDTWDDIHITFYDNNGRQILQGGHGYIMDYAGKKGDYKYFRIPIPEDAARFKLNNGMGKDEETSFCEILRKTNNASAEPDTSTDYTKGRLVYELSSPATVTRIEPNFTVNTTSTTSTTVREQESGVDFTNTNRNDKLKILDDAPWITTPTSGIGTVKVTYFKSNGDKIGTYTLIQSEADANSKRWYSVEIPDDAATFTLSSPKGTGTITTAQYEIYQYSADGSGVTGSWTADGMYYHTKSDGTLELIASTVQSVNSEANDETYAKRGDNLYLVCGHNTWENIKVVFYGADGTPFQTDAKAITAKYINTSDGDEWYKVSIPDKAVSFKVIGKDNSDATIETPQAEIYELKEKLSRYSENYTLGDMQYRLPAINADPKNLTLLYPIFTQNDIYSLEVGGKTIYSGVDVSNVDESKVSNYTSVATAPTDSTPPTTTSTPVLYGTSTVSGDTGYTQAATSSNIVKKWTEGGGDDKLRFDNSTLKWGTVKADFYNSSGTSVGSATVSDSTGTVVAFDVPAGATKVKFSKNGSTTTGEHTDIIDRTSEENLKNQLFTPSTSTLRGDTFVFGFPNIASNDWQGYVYMYNDHGYCGNDWPGYKFGDDNTVTEWYNNNSPGQKGYKVKIQSNSSGEATHAVFVYWYNQDGSNHYFKTKPYSLSNLVVGKGIYGSTNHPYSSMDDLPTGDGEDEINGSYNIDFNSSKTIINGGTFASNNSGGTVTYTATYQPEDRYGLINDINSTDDANNYIYINTTEISNPYVWFYDSSNNPIGGIKNGETAVTTGIKADQSGNVYSVRLPKNAKSFKVANGTGSALGEAIPLEETIYVSQDSEGNLSLHNSVSADNTTIENYRHAGTTFTVNSSGAATVTALRSGTTLLGKASTMEDPLNPRTDADYVFFTDKNNAFANNGVVYAYYYGAEDGEYTSWPGVKASTNNSNVADTTYTDNNGNTVYMFRVPKGMEGKYSNVIFTNGLTGDAIKITQPQALTGGKNYALASASGGQHGAFAGSGKVYSVTASDKTTTPTTNYTSLTGKTIYIVNNGTQNLISGGTVNTASRFTLDEMHIVFYSDADGSKAVGNADGYKPDKVEGENYNDSDVYRITVPDGANYFQITNGKNKYSTGTDSQLRERYSEIKAISNNGLYKFVDGTTDVSKYLASGATVPAEEKDRRYMLSLENENSTKSEEEIPDSTTNDIHLATIVTGEGGTQEYIKWLKQKDGEVDTEYLNHTNADIYNPVTQTGTKKTIVKVVKAGDYYWKEVKAPTGYEVVSSTVDAADGTITVTDKPIVGKLEIEKLLAGTGYNTENDKNTTFKFHVVFTTTNDGKDLTNENYIKVPSGVTVTNPSRTAHDVHFDIEIANNTAEVNRTITNIPYGTSYTVKEVETEGWKNLTGSDDGIKGEITSSATATASFTNAKTGSLTVSKTVDNQVDASEIDTEFKFTVKLYNTNVDFRDYTFAYTYDPTSGVKAITPAASDHPNEMTLILKESQSATISGIPAGTTYQVSEDTTSPQPLNTTNKAENYWVIKYKIDSSEIQVGSSTGSSNEITSSSKVTFTNEYHKPDDDTPQPSENEIILTKIAKERVGTNAIGQPLAGAGFQLVRVDGDTEDKTYRFTKNGSEYTYATSDGECNQTDSWLTTGADGKLHIKNLPNGNYYLVEQTAPSGYSVNTKHFEFTVDSNTTTLNFTCSDEMAPAYIKLYEHINERRNENWGDPTFIFKITQTHYYDTAGNLQAVTGDKKSYTVALTVDDDGTLDSNILTSSETDEDFRGWIVEYTDENEIVDGTTQKEYQGMYHIDNQGRIKVELGTYEITRVPVSRYKFVTAAKTDAYESTADVQKENLNASREPLETVTITDLTEGKTVDVHYYDKVEYYDKFTHVDTKINQFYKTNVTVQASRAVRAIQATRANVTIKATKTNATIKGIRVEYTAKVPTSSSSATIETTSNNFKAWYIFADGTEGVMNPTEKAKINFITSDADATIKSNLYPNGNKLTISNPSDYASKVYTIKALYTYTDANTNRQTKFTTNFDIAFAAKTETN